jgi:menaquinone-9 beta-reductase
LSTSTNARTDVDVLVIGAGPGGSTTAYYLARHGLDVLMVERSAFPREKVCGDGITPRGVASLHRMGVDTSDPGFERIDGLRIHSRRVTLELPWPSLEDFPPYGLVRSRADFDEMLVRRAEKAGARLSERTEAVEPIVEDGWVKGATLRGTEEADSEPSEVRAQMVIACDGAASRFSVRAGVRRRGGYPMGIAARRYHRIDHHPGPWFEVWMDLWDGASMIPGYGWAFPVADGRVNLGAGLLDTYKSFKSMSAQGVFDAFSRMLPADWGVNEDTAEGRVLSGPLPMGFSRAPQAVPGMLLVGDAAGAVNPFNGEGIAYAMETGEIAAELVHEALVKDRPGLAQMYPAVLRERYARYYFIGRKWVQLLGHPSFMRAFTDYGLPQEWLMRFALRFMGNLTDGGKGDAQDKLMEAIIRLAPAS